MTSVCSCDVSAVLSARARRHALVARASDLAGVIWADGRETLDIGSAHGVGAVRPGRTYIRAP
jgi:hypothetical protein